VVIGRGDVWWADMPDPVGSGAGLRRPVVVVQGDAINSSRIATVVCVPITSNLKWAKAPGNVLLSQSATGLPKESVANVSLIVALDKSLLSERVGRLTKAKVDLILSGIDIILGR
jgi:mRNA interferase MazF